MEIRSGSLGFVRSVGVFPGGFDPPTIAHWELARAARKHVDCVLFTLPRQFPHKTYDRVGLEERLQLLARLSTGDPGFAVALADGGLFIDMAREAAQLTNASDVRLICGRDAAERVIGWNYPPPDSIESHLEEYGLLVAARCGDYEPSPALKHRVGTLEMPRGWDGVSSSSIRSALAEGTHEWRAWAPSHIADDIERLYSPLRVDSRNARSR